MRNIVFVLVVFCLFACNGKQKDMKMDFVEIWSYEATNSPKLISECVDSVSYLLLRTNEDAIFRNIDKMVFRNDLIYVADFRTRKIVVYDMRGNCRFVLNRFGAGEGEYQEMKSFAVTDTHIYVLDNYRRKAYMYDAFTGEYEGKKELPITAWDIEVLSKDRFLLAYVPLRGGGLAMEQERCLVFITDNDFNILQGVYPYDEDYSEPLGLTCYFTTDEDNVFFTSYQFDGVTVFPKSHPEDYFRIGIDFKNGLSEEERFDAEKMTGSQANYLGGTPFFCGNYVSLDVVEGQYGFTCLYDRKHDMFFHNPSDENASSFNVLLYPIGCYGNQFVSVIPGDYDLYQELVHTGFKRAVPAVEEQIKNGDFVLLFYAMKS